MTSSLTWPPSYPEACEGVTEPLPRDELELDVWWEWDAEASVLTLQMRSSDCVTVSPIRETAYYIHTQIPEPAVSLQLIACAVLLVILKWIHQPRRTANDRHQRTR